jgi:hypothetical protein
MTALRDDFLKAVADGVLKVETAGRSVLTSAQRERADKPAQPAC